MVEGIWSSEDVTIRMRRRADTLMGYGVCHVPSLVIPVVSPFTDIQPCDDSLCDEFYERLPPTLAEP